MVAKGNQLRAAIRAAVENDRDQITPDLGGKGSTDSFADAIVQRLHA
jgi:isocitrate dehydrogenase (NAD+)